MKGTEKFINNPIPFPDDDINPQDKRNKPDWILQVGQAIWSCFVRNEGGFHFSDAEKFETLRSYYHGRQSTAKYRKILSASENESDELAKGYENVDYEIYSPMPKYANWLRQKFNMLKHRPRVRNLSKESGLEKEEQKWRAWLYNVHGSFLEQFDKAAGLEIPKPEYIPASQEELQIYQEIHGFSTKQEIAMNDLLNFTDMISNFDDTKDKLFDDAISIGAMVAKDYTDIYTGQVKSKYINPARFVCEYSLDNGFTNSRYAGHWEDTSILDIRKETGMSEEELKAIALQFVDYGNNNQSGMMFDRYDIQYDNGRWGYDTFKIPVLHYEYKTVDIFNKKFYTNKFDRETEVPYNWGDKPNKRTRIESNPVVMIYRSKWIIGSEYVWDYGPQYDIPRPRKRDANISYHAYKIPGKSIVESVIQNLDGVHLAFIRAQNAIANASPSGIAIEYKSLQNVSLGEKDDDDVHPMVLLEIKKRTGDLIYSSTTHRGEYVPNAARPIQELKGGAGAQFEEAIRSMELHFGLIGDAIGIYRETIGQPAGSGTTATAVKSAEVGANLVLGPIYNAFKHVRRSLSINTVLRGSLLLKYNKNSYDLYHPALGYGLEILKLTPDMAVDELGMDLVVAPDDAQVERIHMAAMQSMNKNQEGFAGISMGDYLMIMGVVEDGNLEWAEALLNHRISKAEELQHKRKQENTILQNQGLKELEQEKLNTEIMKIKANEQSEIKKNKEIEKEKRLTEAEKHKHKLAEIREKAKAEGEAKAAVEVVKSDLEPETPTAGAVSQ